MFDLLLIYYYHYHIIIIIIIIIIIGIFFLTICSTLMKPLEKCVWCVINLLLSLSYYRCCRCCWIIVLLLLYFCSRYCFFILMASIIVLEEKKTDIISILKFISWSICEDFSYGDHIAVSLWQPLSEYDEFVSVFQPSSIFTVLCSFVRNDSCHMFVRE